MNKNFLHGAAALTILGALAGCSSKASLTPPQQSGGNPPLPAAQNFLVPPMQVPDGCKSSGLPTASSIRANC
jgi:hypothetical protein